MRDDRPVSISQSANSNIPMDTTPMVISSLLLLHSSRSLKVARERYNLKVYNPMLGILQVWWVCNRAWGGIKGQLRLTSRDGAVQTCSTPIASPDPESFLRELCAPLMDMSNAGEGSKSRRSGVWTPEGITVL